MNQKGKVYFNWQAEVKDFIREKGGINVVLSDSKKVQWLIKYLAEESIPFLCDTLTAGAKHITTETDTCEYCKRKMEQCAGGSEAGGNA